MKLENWPENLFSGSLYTFSIKSNRVMCETGAFWALDKPLVAPYMFVDIDKLPEPIKKYQCKPIQTIEARKILCNEIFNLCKTDIGSEN